MKLNFLGGAYEIGASCILVKIDSKNILLDCGIRQSALKDPLPNFRTIQEYGGVDAIIISHAHMDHIGSLPIISKEYPQARIYMNNMTKDLVRVLLYDSIKVMNNREAEIPLYAETQVEDMLNRVFTINYEVEFPIFDNIKLTFYNAGHIAGAACVYIQSSEGALFYSGDFSIFPQKSIEGAKIPRLRPDVAIFESTYGDKLHANRELEEQRLINLAAECINNKGKMLIPAFALGRSQEILLILKRAINKKQLSKVNIYVDGMVRNINSVYKLNPLFLKNTLGKKVLKGIEPFYDNNVKKINKKEERDTILQSDESCIIVSSSGMLTGGPSTYYAEKIAPMENGYIVITGYQDEESPGRKLLNLYDADEDKRVLSIGEKSIPVKCKVEKVGLSAHGDKGEIKALINLLSPKNLFLVHGDGDVIDSLGTEISMELNSNVFVPRCGEDFHIVIKKPRKQWKKSLPHTLNKKEEFNENNLETLWNFIREYYGEKLFTIEELLYIWSGNSKIKVSCIENMQKLIVPSIYFQSDNKRLFLFKVANKEDVEEALKPKELKPNELNGLIENYFSQYNYKKASLIYDHKKIILNFDFPKTVDSSIYNNIELFQKESHWNVEINTVLNNNAAEALIRNLLKEADIKKISFMLSDGKVIVNLNSPYELKNEQDIFRETTGYKLKILYGEMKSDSVNSDDNSTFTTNSNFVMEQNEALKSIDENFENEDFKPYKKGIKNNSLGKYIELSFITPNIGRKYAEKIEKLSHATGWNIGISKSVNMNEIINIASSLCTKKGIVLKKNPSFNSALLTVTLKLQNTKNINLESLKEEFETKTGCNIIFL